MDNHWARSLTRDPSDNSPSTITMLGTVVFAIGTVSILASTLVGSVGTNREAASAAVARQQVGVPGARLITFVDRPDGGIVISEVPSGTLIKTIAPETDHFIRTIMRSLVRERRKLGMANERPFALSRAAEDGRLELTDLATGRRIELNAFGPTNFGAFAELLDRRTIQSSTAAKTE